MELILLIVVVGSILLLIAFAYFGYSKRWGEWTGLSQRTIKKPGAKADVLPGKTAWDWLNLLIVPSILVLVTFWFASLQQGVQQRTEELRAQNASLQGYLGEMQQLVVESNLFRPDRTTEVTAQQPGAPGTRKIISEVHLLARARTLTVLEEIGPTQKRSVIQFLIESNLIDRGDTPGDPRPHDKPYVNLYGANLKDAELQGIVLYSTYLKAVDLQGAMLLISARTSKPQTLVDGCSRE